MHGIVRNINLAAINGTQITEDFIQQTFDQVFYLPYEAIKAAFVTMLNKLIFAYKRVLLPYYETLKNSDNSGNYQSVPELKSKIQRNAERKNELKKLRVGGFLDSAMYTHELRQIERQNEEYRAELKNLEKSL